MRKHLFILACAALLGAPPAAALTVTLTSGFGSSFLEIGSATDSAVHHLSTLFPTVVPFVDSDSVTEGASSNASTYDLSDNALTITFDHTRAPSAGAHAVSEGDIYFSVDEDVGYELSGTYSAIDPDGTLIDLSVKLLHLTTPSWLARSTQISRSTVNEAFVVGESGGDFSNFNLPIRSAQLVTGPDTPVS
jgi:hypothetical protein